MAATATFLGSVGICPAVFPGSGAASVSERVDEQQVLANTGVIGTYTLDSDSPFTVSLAPLTAVTWMAIKVLGGPIRVRTTSSLGTTQAIPVGSYLFINNPPPAAVITAIDLTRTPATESVVQVMLGQSLT